MNSSNVALSQLATTEGVIALTDAVRGTPIASDTSPKYAPGWRTPAAPRPPNLLAASTPESTT